MRIGLLLSMLIVMQALHVGFSSSSLEQVLAQARAEYRQQDYSAAIQRLEAALETAPDSAELHLWLGRAYGREAQRSSWWRAMGLAKRTRVHFERAVDLAPDYLAAWQDLFDYYRQAPPLLGGGEKPALQAAAQLLRLDAAAGRRAYAELGRPVPESNTLETDID